MSEPFSDPVIPDSTHECLVVVAKRVVGRAAVNDGRDCAGVHLVLHNGSLSAYVEAPSLGLTYERLEQRSGLDPTRGFDVEPLDVD